MRRHRHLDQTIAPVTAWRAVALGSTLLIALAACPTLNGPPTSVTVWQAQLQADSAHRGLSGQAALAAQLGGTDAGIGISGAQPGAVLTWQVRVGDCVAAGPSVASASAFPELTVGTDGGASADMRIGHLLSADTAYYAEVRDTGTDTARILCGEFQLQ